MTCAACQHPLATGHLKDGTPIRWCVNLRCRLRGLRTDCLPASTAG